MPKKNLFAKLEKKILKRTKDVVEEVNDKHEEVKDWLDEHKKEIKHLSKNLAQTTATSAATGALLIATGSVPIKNIPADDLSRYVSSAVTRASVISDDDISAMLSEKLGSGMPNSVRPLTSDEKINLEKTINETLGVNVKASLDGYSLNTNYGRIGGEQHLVRYPGDSLLKHARNTSDWLMYGPAGMAPGRGAWGYFPNEETERYYVVVQTFLSPNWNANPKAAYDWFKFRKVLVVNPKTGQSVIGAIGDSGPAEWTGKHYGGSPEVMHYLGLARGSRQGPVMIFFIDDKDGKNYPLGPVTKKVN